MKENDIVIKRISSEEELWFAERLYLSSFPDGERREIADWIRYTWTKPEFFNNIIEYGGERVGFISYWGWMISCMWSILPWTHAFAAKDMVVLL